MDQLVEFIGHHPFLVGALGVVILIFLANEAWRNMSGRGPISTAEAVRLMDNENAVVVDTRSASEYKKGHILNAKHIPASGIVDRAREISRDTEHPIILYCNTGQSAQAAASKLQAKGYTRVHVLKGGIGGWESDGLPVTTRK